MWTGLDIGQCLNWKSASLILNCPFRGLPLEYIPTYVDTYVHTNIVVCNSLCNNSDMIIFALLRFVLWNCCQPGLHIHYLIPGLYSWRHPLLHLAYVCTYVWHCRFALSVSIPLQHTSIIFYKTAHSFGVVTASYAIFKLAVQWPVYNVAISFSRHFSDHTNHLRVTKTEYNVCVLI